VAVSVVEWPKREGYLSVVPGGVVVVFGTGKYGRAVVVQLEAGNVNISETLDATNEHLDAQFVADRERYALEFLDRCRKLERHGLAVEGWAHTVPHSFLFPKVLAFGEEMADAYRRCRERRGDRT
jgi:hypothetical protein